MFLLQMSGQPGSGKSTLAKEIANKTGAIVIDNDIIKSAILELDIKEITFDMAGKITYNVNFNLARYYLKQKSNVIIDTPCRFPFIIENGMRISKECDAKYKYIECYVKNFDETRKRLEQRNKMLSQVSSNDVKKESYSEWLKQAIFPDEEYLSIETNQPLENYLEECIQYLQK